MCRIGIQPSLEFCLFSSVQASFPTGMPIHGGDMHGILLTKELFILARLRSLIKWG